jgi:hypothetical protein
MDITLSRTCRLDGAEPSALRTAARWASKQSAGRSFVLSISSSSSWAVAIEREAARIPTLEALRKTQQIIESHLGGGIKSDLCEYERCGGKWSALEAATDWAVVFWGSPEDGLYCTGPYGNGKTHDETQYACYGVGEIFEWQVNVDPWGEETYHHRN